MNISSMKLKTIHALFAVIFLATTPAWAQVAADDAPPPVDILPAVSTADESNVVIDESGHTHPPIKLTPDKSELLRLDKPAGSVLIGNPNHLSILPDSADTLVLIARAPGASSFTVLGKDGSILMQRHVIVASPKQEYIRVRRSCAGSDDEGCRETSVFYCPDMCHEIILGGVESAGDASAAGGGTSGNGGDTAAPEPVAPSPAPTDTE